LIDASLYSVYPHGAWMSVLAMVMAIISSFFTCIKMNADYVEANVSLSQDFPGFSEVLTGDTAHYALFNYEDKFDEEEEFYRYTRDQLDLMGAGLKAARVFGSLATALIGISTILLVATSCVEYKQAVLKGIGIMLLLGSMFDVLTFTIFASTVCSDPYSCDFYGGAWMPIVAMAVSFVAGVVTLQIKPSSPVTETETTMPDGTANIIMTKVNADESNAVEETAPVEQA
jgi:hypothetical protein